MLSKGNWNKLSKPLYNFDMNDVIYEHIIPKVYLKYFTKDGQLICRYNKHKNETNLKNISNVECRKHYYDIYIPEMVRRKGYDENKLFEKICKELNIDFSDNMKNNFLNNKQHIENAFSIYEKNYSDFIREFIEKIEKNINSSKSDKIVSLNDKTQLSLFMGIQFVRIESYKEITCLLALDENRMQDSLNILLDKKTRTIQHGAAIVEEIRNRNLANIFFNLDWQFSYNATEVDYITSDNPISIDINTGQNEFVLFFPITPNIGLHMHSKKQELGFLDCDIKVINDPSIIKKDNLLQLSDCNENVYYRKNIRIDKYIS